MAGTKGLGSLAGILLASVMASGANAAATPEMCPREQARAVTPIAAPIVPAATSEETKTPDCPSAATAEGEQAAPSPDAVCVYTPGVEKRSTQSETSQSESKTAPQVSAGDGRQSYIGHISQVAGQVWSAIVTAVTLIAGPAQL